MNVQIRYQNGTLTIGLGGQSLSSDSSGGDPGLGPQGGDPGLGPQGGDPGLGPQGGDPGLGPQGGDPGLGPQGGRSGGGSARCGGGLVIGPIVIPIASQDLTTGGDPGLGPQGGDPGLGPQGGDPGLGPQGGDPGLGPQGGDPGLGPQGGGSGTGSGSCCCCPTVIGPIVFSGCCSSGGATSPTAPLTPVNIQSVLLPGCAHGSVSTTPFQMQPQQKEEWCWDAVAVSVNDFLDSPGAWTQTALAENIMPCQYSPQSDPNDPFDCVFSLDGALKVTGNLDKARFNQYVTFADLKTYWACVPYPVGVRIVWDDGGGAHFIALSGYTQFSGGQQLVTVNDPAPLALGGAVKWDYDALRSYYQCPGNPQGPTGHWNDTYFVKQ
jgi:hypothetical protein